MEVYVSGLGAICAAGTNVAECLESMRSGCSMLAPVRRFQTALGFPVGEVCLSDDELKDVLDIDRQEVASRTALLGLKAVDEALTDFVSRSGKADGLKELRCAFLSGTSVGGMDLSEVFWQEHRNDLAGGDARSLSMHTPRRCYLDDGALSGVPWGQYSFQHDHKYGLFCCRQCYYAGSQDVA